MPHLPHITRGFLPSGPGRRCSGGEPEEAGTGSGKGLERRESEKRGPEREGALGAREGPRVPAVQSAPGPPPRHRAETCPAAGQRGHLEDIRHRQAGLARATP